MVQLLIILFGGYAVATGRFKIAPHYGVKGRPARIGGASFIALGVASSLPRSFGDALSWETQLIAPLAMLAAVPLIAMLLVRISGNDFAAGEGELALIPESTVAAGGPILHEVREHARSEARRLRRLGRVLFIVCAVVLVAVVAAILATGASWPEARSWLLIAELALILPFLVAVGMTVHAIGHDGDTRVLEQRMALEREREVVVPPPQVAGDEDERANADSWHGADAYDGTSAEAEGPRAIPASFRVNLVSAATAQLEYVGFGRRFAAGVIDLALILMLGAVTGFIVGLSVLVVGMARGASEEALDAAVERLGDFTVTGYLLGLLALVVYLTVMQAVHGSTPGKMILGMTVRGENGDACTAKAALVRSLAFNIDSLVFGLPAAISINGSPLKQRWGDKWAHTVVVRTRSLEPPRLRSHLRFFGASVLACSAYVVLVGFALVLTSPLEAVSGETRPTASPADAPAFGSRSPALYGEWVVWEDQRKGEAAVNDRNTLLGDVYALNLVSGEERSICAAFGGQWEPDVSGEWVAWEDARSGDQSEEGYALPDVYAFNLRSGEERAICTTPSAQYTPSVSGEWVVWADQRAGRGSSDIHAFNLASGEERSICTAFGGQWEPDVSGEWVVWADGRTGEQDSDGYALPDIYAFNLTTGEERVICAAKGAQWSPVVSGEWVVWEDRREDGFSGDIYALNLTSGKERRICTAEGWQGYPTVSGEWVVWADGREGVYDHDGFPVPDIYAFNLTSGEERAVCTAAGRQTLPDVSGEWVVWEDERDGEDNTAIYAFSLTSGEERAVCRPLGKVVSAAIPVR